ncbi:MAG: hypothetical protein QXS19_04860 [Candidatus Methanomethylicia archaeon]
MMRFLQRYFTVQTLKQIGIDLIKSLIDNIDGSDIQTKHFSEYYNRLKPMEKKIVDNALQKLAEDLIEKLGVRLK